MKRLTILALPLALAACAQGAASIAPTPMGGAYMGTTCQQAQALQAQEQQTLAALTDAQNGAVVGDALGVFLIGVPVSSLTGADKEGEIAASKGKLLALDARLTGC